MSKSITVTLPNDVADTLRHHMEKLGEENVPGVNISKSAYVSIAVKKQLAKDGNVIAENKKEPEGTVGGE